MADNTAVRLTSRGIKLRIVQSGVFIIIVCAVVTILFNTALSLQTRTERIVLLGLWMSMLLMWAVGSALAWIKRNKEQYYFTSDAVVITKQGFVGSRDDLLRYDSVLSVGVTQTFDGKRHDYGNIVLSIPRLYGQVVLRDVLQPQEQALTLKKHIGTRGTGSGALVY